MRNTLWNKLQLYYLNNYFICASIANVSNSITIKELKAAGLSTDHAYSCLFFYEIEIDNQKLRLVKIRNPWGNSQDFNINIIKWIILKNRDF